MSPISFTQQGIVSAYELAKILILTSGGLLEVALPLTDDDRRDMESISEASSRAASPSN